MGNYEEAESVRDAALSDEWLLEFQEELRTYENYENAVLIIDDIIIQSIAPVIQPSRAPTWGQPLVKVICDYICDEVGFD